MGKNIGKLEAAVTSGGLSTMPWTYENKLKVLENKTLRYLGHWEWMKAYRQLGLFNEKEILYNKQKISPRDFYHFLLQLPFLYISVFWPIAELALDQLSQFLHELPSFQYPYPSYNLIVENYILLKDNLALMLCGI